MKLECSVNGVEVNAPLIFSDILTHDYTVDADYVIPRRRLMKGFYLKAGSTGGAYRAVTLAQYLDNGGEAYIAQNDGPTDAEMNVVIHAAIAAGDYVDLYLQAYEWALTPLVFIEYDVAASDVVNIGLP